MSWAANVHRLGVNRFAECAEKLFGVVQVQRQKHVQIQCESFALSFARHAWTQCWRTMWALFWAVFRCGEVRIEKLIRIGSLVVSNECQRCDHCAQLSCIKFARSERLFLSVNHLDCIERHSMSK
jgi:hypothetical protein